MRDTRDPADVMRNVTEMADMMRNVTQATQNYNMKALEFATGNCNATLTYLSKLATVKSPSESIEVTTRHVCEQTGALEQES